MDTLQHYRLTQDTAVLARAGNGRYSITQLQMGTVVALNRPTSDLASSMIEVESEGQAYTVFATDLAERTEPVLED